MGLSYNIILYDYGKHKSNFWGVFIFILVQFSIFWAPFFNNYYIRAFAIIVFFTSSALRSSMILIGYQPPHIQRTLAE